MSTAIVVGSGPDGLAAATAPARVGAQVTVLEALDEGEVRMIVLEAQPYHRKRREHRPVDTATGEFEWGHLAVGDMLTSQAWDGEIPVDISFSGAMHAKGVKVA